MTEAQNRNIRRLIVSIIVLCIVVILWGAFVRFSNSGDGCGDSWPLCEGSILPQSESIALWIEYTHRLTSGILGFLVVALFGLTFYWSERGDPLRKFVFGVAFFTLTEALVGAGLVLKGLVGKETSIERAIWLAMHLINTLTLLACLTGAYLQTLMPKKKLRFFPSIKMLPYVLLFLLLGLAGSLASLSNTLYPTTNLLEGMAADFDPSSPLYVRLRLIHPLMGVLFFLLIIDWWKRSKQHFPEAATRLLLFTGTNFMIGALTLVLLSPLAGKLLHILMTDLVWMQLYGLSLLVSSTGDLESDDITGMTARLGV